MAITMTLSNHYKYQLMDKQIDLSADTVKIILMNNTFAFDKDTDATLADVTGDQLASLHGYTQDDKTLANLVLTEDDGNDQAIMTCDDVEWTASGGNLGNGATGSAILYDDTTGDDTVIGCIDYGSDYTIPDGSGFQITDVDVATT